MEEHKHQLGEKPLKHYPFVGACGLATFGGMTAGSPSIDLVETAEMLI